MPSSIAFAANARENAIEIATRSRLFGLRVCRIAASATLHGDINRTLRPLTKKLRVAREDLDFLTNFL